MKTFYIFYVKSRNFANRIIVECDSFKKDNSCVYWISLGVRFISLATFDIVNLIIVLILFQ